MWIQNKMRWEDKMYWIHFKPKFNPTLMCSGSLSWNPRQVLDHVCAMLHKYVNHFALSLRRRKIWKFLLLVTSICHPLHNYSALWSTAWWYNYERQGRHTHLWEGGDHWPLPLSCPVHFHNDTRKNHHDSLILDLIKYTKCFSTAGGFLILLSWKVHNKKWFPPPPKERKSHTPLGFLTLATCDTTQPVH